MFRSLIVIILIIHEGSSLCSLPCEQQIRGKYVGVFGTAKGEFSVYSLKNSHIVMKGDHELECFEKSGPFYVIRRRGNEFRCAKIMAVDQSGTYQVFYGLPYRKYKNIPTLCEVCYGPGEWQISQYIAADALVHETIGKVNPRTMGCNVPKNCPMFNPKTDIPCCGCEPVVDNGLCCKIPSNPYTRHYKY